MLVLLRVNPFDPRTVLLAKHAQHVVLVHFPIALFLTAAIFDLVYGLTKRREFADAAYYNLTGAAIAVFPVVVTGVLAWRFQLDGQKIKGVLLLHFVLAAISSALICGVWARRFRVRQSARGPVAIDYAVEIAATVAIALTAHLGGFLSGVNGGS